MRKARIISGAVATATALAAVSSGTTALAAGPDTARAACFTDAKIDGKQWIQTFDNAFANPNYLKCGSTIGYLYQGRNYVFCKKWGQNHSGE